MQKRENDRACHVNNQRQVVCDGVNQRHNDIDSYLHNLREVLKDHIRYPADGVADYIRYLTEIATRFIKATGEITQQRYTIIGKRLQLRQKYSAHRVFRCTGTRLQALDAVIEFAESVQ